MFWPLDLPPFTASLGKIWNLLGSRLASQGLWHKILWGGSDAPPSLFSPLPWIVPDQVH